MSVDPNYNQISSLENHARKLNYTITAPSDLLKCGAPKIVAQSALYCIHSIDPRAQVSRGLTDICRDAWQAIVNICRDAWQAIVNFFKSLFNCFGLFSRSATSPAISPSERENRLSKNEASIHRSLEAQMQRNAEQMANEPVKQFQYLNAANSDLDATGPWNAHEEQVGNLQVGVAHAKGRRPAMEDEHLAASFDLMLRGRRYPVQLFGIFDGHGGPMASRFVRDRLQQKLQETLVEFNQNGLSEAGIWRALKMTCVRLNRDFKNLFGADANNQGTTATIAMILDNHLWTANVGDSRTVLDNNGTPVQLSHDAKPDDERYRKGIEHRGGEVVHFDVPRVNGDLAVARAIGDHRLNGAISARPKITEIPMSEIRDGHLILCCDGIYDVSRTVDVVAAVHANRAFSPETLAKNIIYSAYQAGSGDNLSALVVKI